VHGRQTQARQMWDVHVLILFDLCGVIEIRAPEAEQTCT
jgi:hypothetical protein